MSGKDYRYTSHDTTCCAVTKEMQEACRYHKPIRAKDPDDPDDYSRYYERESIYCGWRGKGGYCYCEEAQDNE